MHYRLFFMLSFLFACNTAQSEDIPPKEALQHFCAALAQGPSNAALNGPALKRQEIWMQEMTQTAVQNKVPKWKKFVRGLEKQDATTRQAWLDAGVAKHGLETECAVMKKTAAP